MRPINSIVSDSRIFRRASIDFSKLEKVLSLSKLCRDAIYQKKIKDLSKKI